MGLGPSLGSESFEAGNEVVIMDVYFDLVQLQDRPRKRRGTN